MITEILKTLLGSEQAAFCIFCERMIPNRQMVIQHSETGVCRSCMNELIKIQNNQSFEGTIHTDFLMAPYFYKEPLCSAIHKYKFRHARIYGDTFADLIIRYLKIFTPLKDYDMIIPVPLSEQRYLERGYNQSEIMARKICSYYHIDLNNTALVRIKETKRQSDLRGLSRRENMKNAFHADANMIKDKKIIVLDDIITTGSTIDSCAKTLLEAGAKNVIGVSLAYVYHKKKQSLFYRSNPIIDTKEKNS